VRILGVAVIAITIIVGQLKAAEAIELYHSNAHPYMAHSIDEQGFLAELVIRAARDLKLEVSPIYVPWKRAQIVAQSSQDRLIIAVRTKKREALFNWVVPLFTMETVIATKDQEIGSIPEAVYKLNTLTVMPGVALQYFLLNEGFPHDRLLTLPINKKLMHFLQNKEKTGWIAQRMQIKSFWKNYGPDAPLKIGGTITKRKLWLACSKKCNAIDLKSLKAEILKMQNSAWYQKRLASYIGPTSN